ncbi:MAG: hypothetical protein KA436_08770 [Oligoflexales bacterium]|nr:hypothetical protein [Oligoflexales bacterium]
MLLTEYFRDALRELIFYPRWIPNLGGGFGYPTFVFYQPLFFFITSFTGFISQTNSGLACLLALYLFSFVGAVGTYRLSRFFCGKIPSLLTAFLFLLSPYVYVNLYVRADFSEYAAMMIFPLCLSFNVGIQKSNEALLKPSALWPCLGLALSLAALITTHPIIAMNGCGALLFFSILTYSDSWHPRELVRNRQMQALLLAFSLGLVISAPYWVTVLTMKKYINETRFISGYYSPEVHVVWFHQLLSLKWGFGGSTPDNDLDGMPFPLGLFFFIGACSGFLLGRKNRFIVCSFILYVTLIFMVLPFFPQIWRFHLLKFEQFPWRLLAVISSFQVLSILGIATWKENRRDLRTGFFLSLIILSSIFFYREQFSIHPQTPPSHAVSELSKTIPSLKNNDYHMYQTYSDTNDFLPLSANIPVSTGIRGIGTPMIFADAADITPREDNTDYYIHYLVETTRATELVVQQFYFPGWFIKINETILSRDELERNLNLDGLMQVSLPSAGTYEIVAYYDGAPFWRSLVLLSFFLTILGGFALIRLTRRSSLNNLKTI